MPAIWSGPVELPLGGGTMEIGESVASTCGVGGVGVLCVLGVVLHVFTSLFNLFWALVIAVSLLAKT